jgi:hypothetical protein
MICQTIKFYKLTGLVFPFLFLNILNAQEAENIYHKQYGKLSFVLQPSFLQKSKGGNNDGSMYPGVKLKKDFSYQFGMYYNFAQSKNFNFKTGIIAREFISKFDLNIDKSEILSGTKDYYLIDYDIVNQYVISIPFKTEYYLKINPKINAVFGASFNLNLITGENYEINKFGVSVYDESNYQNIFTADIKPSQNFNFSTELSIGFNYKTKYALFDLSAYTTGLIAPDYGYASYTIYNLNNSPEKTGTMYFNNEFYGISLVVTPKKGWQNFRKNKKNKKIEQK